MSGSSSRTTHRVFFDFVWNGIAKTLSVRVCDFSAMVKFLLAGLAAIVEQNAFMN